MTTDDGAIWAATVRGVGGPPFAESGELSDPGLGLAGESGEVAALIRRRLRDGTWDADRLVDEPGDVADDRTRLCAYARCPPSQVLERSRSKIDAKIAAGLRK